MSNFFKCKTCRLHKSCEYLKRGEICNQAIHATTYEEEYSCVKGDAVKIDFNTNEGDVRLDLVVERKNISKLWGQVKDIDGNYVDYAMVTLLKPQYVRGEIEYFPIATTFSDCMGFYHFEINKLENGLKYVVSTSK